MIERRGFWISGIWFLAFFCLVFCLDFSTAVAAPQMEQYTVLNPRADLPSINANALAPRLASLEGKTVYVYGSDFVMNPGLEIMLMVARGLARSVPGIKVVYVSDRYGDAKADTVVPTIKIAKYLVDSHNFKTFKEAEQNADAVVTGLGY